MQKLSTDSLSLCTWSLENDISRVRKVLKQSKTNKIHLDLKAAEKLRPLWEQEGVAITCTMVSFPAEDYTTLDSIRSTGGIVPDEVWELNRGIVLTAIHSTKFLNVPSLSFHAGFIDPTNAARFQTFIQRLTFLADAAKDVGVLILLETGQETGIELKHLMEEMKHPSIGINFDPANMILYGKGDPVIAMKLLAPWIHHVHLKDAISSKEPNNWGTEVPWGEGEVNSRQFIAQLKEMNYSGYLAVEREAGSEREKDIITAISRFTSTSR